MDLGGLVDHLVHDDRQEIAEHDVHDRTQAGHGRTDAEAAETSFRNRRVDDAILAELVDESGEHFEGGARLGHVFAHQDDVRIAPHLFGDGLFDGIAERQLAYGRRSLKHRCPR